MPQNLSWRELQIGQSRAGEAGSAVFDRPDKIPGGALRPCIAQTASALSIHLRYKIRLVALEVPGGTRDKASAVVEITLT